MPVDGQHDSVTQEEPGRTGGPEIGGQRLGPVQQGRLGRAVAEQVLSVPNTADREDARHRRSLGRSRCSRSSWTHSIVPSEVYGERWPRAIPEPPGSSPSLIVPLRASLTPAGNCFPARTVLCSR